MTDEEEMYRAFDRIDHLTRVFLGAVHIGSFTPTSSVRTIDGDCVEIKLEPLAITHEKKEESE